MIHPLLDFWTYRRMLRNERRGHMHTVEVSGKHGWRTETALGDEHHPHYWTRQVTDDQRKFLFRLDNVAEEQQPRRPEYWGKPMPGAKRSVYLVLWFGLRDTGIRIAQTLEDGGVLSSPAETIVGINFHQRKVYAAPSDRTYWWATPSRAAIYAMFDQAGWRPWNSDDERIATERIARYQP
jgi:hypothetical protein